MSYKSDIEIAREAQKKPIQEIGAKLDIPSEHLLPYGHDKAKIDLDWIAEQEGKPDAKLVLVTAINPTPAGEEMYQLSLLAGADQQRILDVDGGVPVAPGTQRC